MTEAKEVIVDHMENHPRILNLINLIQTTIKITRSHPDFSDAQITRKVVNRLRNQEMSTDK